MTVAGKVIEAADTTPVPRKGPLYAMLGLALGAAGLSAHLVQLKLRLKYLPGFESACNMGGKFNCDTVQTSPYSELLGIPIALYGLPVYLAMAYLALAGTWSEATKDAPDAPRHARNANALLFLAGVLTTLYAIFLGYISLAHIGAVCVFCLSLYVVNIAALVLPLWASRTGFKPLLGASLGVLSKLRMPLPMALAIAIIGGGAGWYWYDSTSKEMFAQAVSGGGPEIAAPAKVAPSNGKAPAAPAPSTSSSISRSAKVTDAGMSEFDIPITKDDYVYGNFNATVTLVDFADFQCSYCRFLVSSLKNIKEKYKDRVRFVFKHYPMNGDCNARMAGQKTHEHACDAAKAAHCAHVQGKFWEMHDKLYDGQEKLDMPSIEGYATAVGIDMDKWKKCLTDPATDARIKSDVDLATKARLSGTPTVYINGRLVRGFAGEIIEYHLDHALQNPKLQAAGVEAKAADASSATMVQGKTATKSFYIDAFEASLDKEGRAVSMPAATPARTNWFDAKAACEKAGKRLCTEEEWVSACTGTPAVDNNNNRFFADDAVEGRMYPYGLFYEAGRCRDAEDEYKGEPGKTGVMAACRTPEGAYDLAGNLGEWVGGEQGLAAQAGGDYRSGERASCNKRTATWGPGIRNNTTGFRCCADAMVEGPKVEASAVDVRSTEDVLGTKTPRFELERMDGTGKMSSDSFTKNKVTYLTFFASWCGPCKRELPEIKKFQDEYGPKGFQVVAVGSDRLMDVSKKFVEQFTPNYPVLHDPESLAMGLFNVGAMPSTFLIDRKGIVRHRHVGFKAEEVAGIVTKIKELMAE